MEHKEYYLKNYKIKTHKQMAKELNIPLSTVVYNLRKAGLTKYKSVPWSAEENQLLIKHYYKPLDWSLLFQLFPNRNKTAIQRHACKLNISAYRSNKKVHVNKQGYIVNHSTRNKPVYKHRQIYEKHYNVSLTSADIIHHIDGNKLNNDISNLRLLNRSEHINLHRSELLRGKANKKI